MNVFWTKEEDDIILKLLGTVSSAEMSSVLRKNGFFRSPHSVRGRIARILEEEEKATTPLNDEEEFALAWEDNFVIEERPKILYFDIETTDLSAAFGEVLMMGYRWHDDPTVHLLSIYDFPNWDKPPIEKRDKPLVEAISNIISEADVLVGHYSTGFDHRFIQTRCLFHGLPPIPDTIHIDTWKIAKYQLRLHSNKLETLAKALDCKERKGSLPLHIWRRSKAHDLEALKMMTDYCKQDVKTQYAVTQKLLPITKNLPNWNLLSGEIKYRCPSCESTDVTKRGFRCTKVHIYQRFQCRRCGRWSRGRQTLANKNAERHMY